jgi:hypothetical protein
MYKYLPLVLLITILQGCRKNRDKNEDTCNVPKALAQNALKVTITKGVWGTIYITEGDCMPKVGETESTCKSCTVKRTVKIYEYTTKQQATPGNYTTGYFDSFSTKLIKEVDTDNIGFFQAELPAGKYTLAFVENGKLFINWTDGAGGLAPFTCTDSAVNINVHVNRAAY